MDTGLSGWAADHADGLARALASAGISLSALAANGQTAQVADAAVAFDALQALEVHANLPAQVTFDHVFAVLDRMDDLGELLFGQVFGANIGIDLGVNQNDLGVAGTDAVDVSQGDLNPFVRWNFYSDDASHVRKL